MSKKLSGMLILCVATLWLSGCAYFRATGPCLGMGCPGHTVGHNAQYKSGQLPKAQNAAAPRAPAPSIQASDNAQVASPPPQAAPAQAKAPETKSSAPNRFTEFFAHLIPHHNKTAKPAPAAD
jgi:hypothetical protein